MINLLDLDREGLTSFFVNLGEKPFRATQVMKWIHQLGVTDFFAMTNLSKALRQQLTEIACLSMPQVVMSQVSQDGTRKWLLQLDSNNCVEMVFIPEDNRGTLCVSSQVGCALDCHFCATAQQGFNRNLTTGEIIAQLWLAKHTLKTEITSLQENTQPSNFVQEDSYTSEKVVEDLPPIKEKQEKQVISNVVLMGMGEPLTNFDNVIKAMNLMLDDFSYGLSWRHITLSTVGIIPALARLKEQCPVNIAISLHATNDALRDQLMPINKKYPLRELIKACHAYIKGEEYRRKITFEYIMLKGINDSPTHAFALIKLLRGLPAKINLIPFNVFPQTHYQCPTFETIDRFRDILMEAGFITVTRKTRGSDIDAACGQLAGKVLNRKSFVQDKSV